MVSLQRNIEALQAKKIQLNITAIFLLDQIKDIIDTIKDTNTILSVFAGRIYDLDLMQKKICLKLMNLLK